jgi:hypothetical protein
VRGRILPPILSCIRSRPDGRVANADYYRAGFVRTNGAAGHRQVAGLQGGSVVAASIRNLHGILRGRQRPSLRNATRIDVPLARGPALGGLMATKARRGTGRRVEICREGLDSRTGCV